MTWKTRLKKQLIPRPVVARRPPRIPSGLYHYQRPRSGDGGFMRYHLRVEPDGSGLLIAGAAEVLRLSPIGSFIAGQLLGGVLPAELVSRHALPRPLIDEVARRLDELGQPSGRFPVFNLADPVAGGEASRLLAPIQADVVLGDGSATRNILDRLWRAGIPHVRFRAPGASSDDEASRGLVAAVRHAEDLGMISGVEAASSRFSTGDFLDALADVGLDYAVVPNGLTRRLSEQLFGAADAEALAAAVAAIRRREMCPVVEVPLIPATYDALESDLAALVELRVANVEVFAVVMDDAEVDAEAGSGATDAKGSTLPQSFPEWEGSLGDASALRPFMGCHLRQVAARIEELAASWPLQVIWLPPVRLHAGESVAEMARCGPRCAGDLSIRVEADGEVIPPRGPRVSAGNLLREPWEALWQRPAFARFRTRVESVTRCDACPGLSICAADCPADPRGWADG